MTDLKCSLQKYHLIILKNFKSVFLKWDNKASQWKEAAGDADNVDM